MNLSWKISKSAKGNIYLAATRWDGSRKVCDVCLFSGQDWAPYGARKATKGQINIVDDLATAFRSRHEKNRGGDGIDVGAGEVKANGIHKFGPFTIALVDDGMINGVSVGGDGAYFVQNGKAYNIDSLNV